MYTCNKIIPGTCQPHLIYETGR